MNQVTGFFLGEMNYCLNIECLINQLLNGMHKMGCNLSLKIYFLYSHLHSLKANLGAVSNKDDECYRHELASIKKRYQGKWITSKLADYSWFLIRVTALTKELVLVLFYV